MAFWWSCKAIAPPRQGLIFFEIRCRYLQSFWKSHFQVALQSHQPHCAPQADQSALGGLYCAVNPPFDRIGIGAPLPGFAPTSEPTPVRSTGVYTAGEVMPPGPPAHSQSHRRRRPKPHAETAVSHQACPLFAIARMPIPQSLFFFCFHVSGE